MTNEIRGQKKRGKDHEGEERDVLKWSPLMRIAAQLRRIAKAFEHHNQIQQQRLNYEHPMRIAKPPRKAEITVPTVQEWNERYQEESPYNRYRD